MVWLFVGGILTGLSLGYWARVRSLIVASALSVPAVVSVCIIAQYSTFNVILASFAVLVTLQVSYLIGLYVSGGVEERHEPDRSRKIVDDGSSKNDEGLRSWSHAEAPKSRSRESEKH